MVVQLVTAVELVMKLALEEVTELELAVELVKFEYLKVVINLSV